MVILIFDVSGKGIMRIQVQAYGGGDMIAVRQIGRESMLVVAVPVGELYD
jgi:hypothetical protein